MNKKIISGLAALAVVFAGAGALPAGTFEGFSLTASAEKVEIVDSGYCGNENENEGKNVTWTLDSEGTLAIDGTGDMENYSFGRSPWYFDSKIKQIIIYNGVTSIGEYAFFGCRSLESITIPDSVTSIDDWAFAGCRSLESITIPDSVMSIGDDAFQYCTSLSSITIPDGVTSVGSYAFLNCTSLVSVTIPDSVTSIGSYAFSTCKSLASVTIPDSVTSIGDRAFTWCTSLTSVTIPSSVTKIDDYAFCSCTSLESITIPDSVTSIGKYAFSDCTHLVSIIIPKSVMHIGKKALGYNEFNNKKPDGFTIKGYKGTAAETYASKNGFNFVSLSDNKYPNVKSEVKDGRFRIKWKPVPGAEKYGIALYQSGSWRVKVQLPANVTSYTSPKLKSGVYTIVVCAKINGKWDTSNIAKRAFRIIIK